MDLQPQPHRGGAAGLGAAGVLMLEPPVAAAAAACGVCSDVFNLRAWLGSSAPSSCHLTVVLTVDRTYDALHLTISRQVMGRALKRI